MAKTIAFTCLLITFFGQPTTLSARNLFPLETLYAQTDKQNYFTGENIWFRAFLVNSQTHVQDTLSRYVYAELINSQREVVERVMIRHNENGVFAGHIPITEELEAGSYILRFFTRHLANFGEEYFFQRVIHIITPQSLEENYLSEQPAPAQDDSFAVTFHPEGGDIPVGTYTKVAFKAINSSGLGENIRGVIVNERGDTITRIQSAHLGMGSFVWRANRNEQFFAIVQNVAGVEKRFELPQARVDAISLQVFRQRGNVIVSLSNSDNRRLPRVLYLTLQNRGDIIYSERWNNNNEVMVIPENELPTGVIGIVLSDSRGVPISKRQIFNTNKTEVVNTTFITDQETHDARERVNATVSITDNENRPLNANFSISVIDNDIAHYDASINILSTLLLTSDLRGHIENPAYYFIGENENAKTHLDLVMLTHGWSRFNVSRIYQEEAMTFETSQAVTGTLRGGFLQRSASQPVLLLALEFGFFDEVYTDDEGRFRFENLEFPEGVKFRLQGRTGTTIQVDEMTFPAVTDFFTPIKATSLLAFNNQQKEQIEEFRRFMQEEDYIWSMELDELVVTARRFRPIITPSATHSLLSSPFNVIREREEIDRLRAPNMQMLFRMLFPGMLLSGNESLIIIDNAEFTFADLTSFPAHNVESVEWVRTAAGRAIFGLRGFHGVFLVTTGDFASHSSMQSNVVMITPLGYQITREFFAPAYTFPEQRANPRADLRTTIFWNPNVTTDENGNANIHFYTSDRVGNYVVIIEGITDEGGIVHTMSRIR